MTATTFDYSKPMVESGKMTQTIESFNVHMNTIKPSFEQGMYLLKKGLLYIGRHFMSLVSAKVTSKVNGGESVVECQDEPAIHLLIKDMKNNKAKTAAVISAFAFGIYIGSVGIAGTFTFGIVAVLTPFVCATFTCGAWDFVVKAVSLLKSFWAWLVK